MAVTLSSQEVAALTGKTERTVRRWAESGKIPAERVLNKFNSPEYLFSLDDLEPHLQQKYFDGMKLTPSPEVAQALTKEAKPLDTYSIDEQEEIAFWLRLVKQWQGYRNKPGANKTEVDANFVQWCKLEYPERAISVDTLYRRWNAMRANDLDGLIDKRGKWKKGKSSIPDPMWQAFLYFFLDERQHPLKKCYEYTKLEMQKSFPELVGDKALQKLKKNLTPLQKKIATVVAVKDLASSKIKSVATKVKNVGKAVATPLIKIKDATAAGISKINSKLKSLAKKTVIPVTVAATVATAALGASVSSGMQLEQQQMFWLRQLLQAEGPVPHQWPTARRPNLLQQ